MEDPYYQFMLFIILICSLLDNTIRNGISLGGEEVNTTAAGIGSIVYFLLIFVVILALFVCTCCLEDKGRLSIFAQLMAASLYYFGDNIDYFMSTYNEALNCDETCVEKVNIAGQATLGTALLIIHTLPILDREDNKKECKVLRYVLNITTILVEIDMIYSVVTAEVHTDLDCSESNRALSWAFFGIATLIGWLSIIFQSIKGMDKILEKNQKDTLIYCVLLGFILFLCLPMYLLSDNNKPLNCEFNCVQNGTANACEPNIYIYRMTFTGIVDFFIGFILIFLGCNVCYKSEDSSAKVI